MVFAMLVLLAVVGLIVMLTRGCEFSPGGPSVDDSAAPSIDANERLEEMAQQVDFPLRNPELPKSWQANSSRLEPIGTGARATRYAEIGLLTGEGGYLRLLQSPASARRLVDEVAERRGAGDSALDAVRVGRVRWGVYPGSGQERSWVASLAGVQVLISGSARPGEFRELAHSVQAARPVRTG